MNNSHYYHLETSVYIAYIHTLSISSAIFSLASYNWSSVLFICVLILLISLINCSTVSAVTISHLFSSSEKCHLIILLFIHKSMFWFQFKNEMHCVVNSSILDIFLNLKKRKKNNI